MSIVTHPPAARAAQSDVARGGDVTVCDCWAFEITSACQHTQPQPPGDVLTQRERYAVEQAAAGKAPRILAYLLDLGMRETVRLLRGAQHRLRLVRAAREWTV